MSDKEIKITFPEEKMEALAFFLGEQNEKVESVLTAHLDKTYEKCVPQQVRKFVDSRIAAAQEGNAQEPRGQRQTRESGRRAGRPSARQNTTTQEERAVPADGERTEQTDAAAESMAEESTGMSMGM